jgi:hypothetical protein
LLYQFGDKCDRRREFIQAFGGFTVYFNGILGAILPYIPVTSLLYSFIFKVIIPTWWLRLAIALVATFIVEGYAVAVMVLDQQVQAYNEVARRGHTQGTPLSATMPQGPSSTRRE